MKVEIKKFKDQFGYLIVVSEKNKVISVGITDASFDDPNDLSIFITEAINKLKEQI